MKQVQFDIAINGVPKYHAVFRVIRLPDNLRDHRELLKVGDLMYWNKHRDIMVKVESSMGLMISSDYLEFVSYMTASEMQRRF